MDESHKKKLCLGHNMELKLAYVHLPLTEGKPFRKVQAFSAEHLTNLIQ